MQNGVWILIPLLCGYHISEAHRVGYDGERQESRRDAQTRNTRFVDSDSGSWATNIGYTSSTAKERGVLGGLLETASNINSGIRANGAGKSTGNEQANAKGSFQIKVDADLRPKAALEDVLASNAQAVGALLDLAQKNLNSRRNFRGSFRLEGNSYATANGQQFGGQRNQEETVVTDGNDSTSSAKATVSTPISSKVGNVKDFGSEGGQQEIRYHSEHIGANGGVGNGHRSSTYNNDEKDIISEENFKTLQREVAISNIPSTNTETNSRHDSTTFENQFSGSGSGLLDTTSQSFSTVQKKVSFTTQEVKAGNGDISSIRDGSYSEDHVTKFETGEDADFSQSEESEEREEIHTHGAKVGRIASSQMSRNSEYDNISGNIHGHGSLSRNVDSGRFASTIEREDATNIYNLRAASQTSSFKESESSTTNLHDRGHTSDYTVENDGREVEDLYLLANDKVNVKSAERRTRLGSEYSKNGDIAYNESSRQSEETDSLYSTAAEGNGSGTHSSRHNSEQTIRFDNSQGNGVRQENGNVRFQTVRTSGNIGQAATTRYEPHPTLLDFKPDNDYIDSDESEEIEDNRSKVLRTVSVISPLKQDAVEFQRGFTGDLSNGRKQESSGHRAILTDNRETNLGISSQNSRNRGDGLRLDLSKNLGNQENVSGSKIVRTELSTSTHVVGDDDYDFEEYNGGHTSYSLQENSSQKLATNGEGSYNKASDESSESRIYRLSVVESGASSASLNGNLNANKHLLQSQKRIVTTDAKGKETLGGNIASGSAESEEIGNYGKHAESELEVEFTNNDQVNRKSGVVQKEVAISSSKSQDVDTSAEIGFTGVNLQNRRINSAQIARNAHSRNYGEDEGFTNFQLKTSLQEVKPDSARLSGSAFNFEPEVRGRPSGSFRRQHFISGGEVGDAISSVNEDYYVKAREQVPYVSYPIQEHVRYVVPEVTTTFHKEHYPRRFPNGKRTEYEFDFGEGSHTRLVRPATKIVRKEVTETVHTSGGPPHANEFGHRENQRRVFGNFREINFDEREHSAINERNGQDFLSPDGRQHEVHHGHGDNRGRHSSIRRFEKGVLGGFDEAGIGGFGSEGHSLDEVHNYSRDKDTQILHRAPISHHVEDNHEGGRIDFKKTIKVTHEIEDVPRHGREIGLDHTHYY